MINWGIIGLGNMANKFASSIKNLEKTKLLSIASKTSSRLEKFGNAYDVDKKYRFNNYEDVLKCDEINAIYISTLNNTHHDLIIKAIDFNKNILCEKPASVNYEESLNIYNKLLKSKVFFMEAIAYRSHEQTNFVINEIKKNTIGRVSFVKSNFGFFIKKINHKSRLFNLEMGGGAILDVGCYPLSFSNLIANIDNEKENINPELINVSGSLCETGVDDIAYATLIYKNNIESKIGVAIRLNMENKTIIEGTKGKLIIENPWLPEKKSVVEIQTKDRYYKSFINSKFEIFENQIDLVNKFILENKKEGDFPCMNWKSTLDNMRTLSNWKKKLIEKNEKDNQRKK